MKIIEDDDQNEIVHREAQEVEVGPNSGIKTNQTNEDNTNGE